MVFVLMKVKIMRQARCCVVVFEPRARKSQRDFEFTFASTHHILVQSRMARQIVGAHPRLGELIAEEVLKRGLLRNALPLDNGFEIGPVNYLEKDGSPKKPKKDPNAPKLRNAYVLYSTSVRAQIREENPDLSFGDVAKEISSRYKAFDADEMAKWQSKADAAKEVYKKEMAEYEKTRPKEKTAEKSSAKKKNGGSDNDGTTIKLSQQVTIGDSRVDYKMELIDNNMVFPTMSSLR